MWYSQQPTENLHSNTLSKYLKFNLSNNEFLFSKKDLSPKSCFSVVVLSINYDQNIGVFFDPLSVYNTYPIPKLHELFKFTSYPSSFSYFSCLLSIFSNLELLHKHLTFCLLPPNSTLINRLIHITFRWIVVKGILNPLTFFYSNPSNSLTLYPKFLVWHWKPYTAHYCLIFHQHRTTNTK